ncbi:MAG: hypothetical protein JWM80_2267, partial [Cyanobacteria bacterium RYN_339]|nr:hypothetical protein [Cyanobacteria bacterium RYN_339]
RSSPLAGANNIDLADYVGRLAWVADWGEVGLNGYMVDIKDGPIGTKGALGVDYRFNLPFNLTLLGEYVDQEDRALGIYSRGIYTRLNYDLSDVVPGLRPFVGYEHSFDNVGSAGVWSDNESTYLAGIRYSVYHGVTLGCELLVGDSDLHSGGNLINRLEVRF